MTAATITPTRLVAAWERARAFWGIAIQVDLPRLDSKSQALAFIDLTTRVVTVNPAKLEQLGATSSLEAVLAHELGHHLRYPHSLATQARLELLEREILPVQSYSLLNLFTDFLINCELAHDATLRDQMVRVYVGMPASAEDVASDPAFYFYLMCFEEAWALDPCALTREAGAELERQYPGCRAEAQLVAQELPNLAPNLFTQFLYFASIVSRYQVAKPPAEDGHGHERNPTRGDHSRPSAGDYADALRRSAGERDAIKRALEEGWLRKEQVPDASASERARAASLPGLLNGDPKMLSEAMALHYRRLAEKYLLKPPPERRSGEPLVPTTLSPWDRGDSPKEIDWIATLLAGGPELGLVSPLKRELESDEPGELPGLSTRRLEIYLDVSGSMPDPKGTLNPMTLAAQVLCLSALRAGGLVRALIYSSNFVAHWEWTRSETTISRFLMSYIGGGTQFPFGELAKSVQACGARQPIRLVLTDSDFHSNLQSKQGAARVKHASERAPFIALLNNSQGTEDWVRDIGRTGARTVPVASLEGFPQVAAALARALFPDAAQAGSAR